MRGVYTAHYDITGLAASKTLMYLTAPATAALEILSVHVTNYNNNSAEQWIVSLSRISTLGSPTATTLTPQKHENGDAASGVTARANVTASEPTYDTNGPVDKQGVSNLAGYHYEPIPEERPIIAPSGSWGVRMLSTPTSTDVGVYIVYREIG
jgi:ABC-type uncharacterized transport system involved in gliding motility auxiliary subunit